MDDIQENIELFNLFSGVKELLNKSFNDDSIAPETLVSYIQEKIDLWEKQKPLTKDLETLSGIALIAEDALSQNNQRKIANAMFLLGMMYQETLIPIDTHINNTWKKLNQTKPLIEKQAAQKAINTYAKVIGEAYWRTAEMQNHTLSEMCEEVYAELHQLLHNHTSTSNEILKPLFIDIFHKLPKEITENLIKFFPSGSYSLKPALREIAPAHATKPGRRKNK